MMNILIDTCDALWFWSGDTRLSQSRRALIADMGNTVFLSSVSVAEICIKFNIGKLPLPEKPQTYVPELRRRHRIAELPLFEKAALLLNDLPDIHRDPFDRQLICQALAHNLAFLTSDPKISEYSGIRIL